MLVYQRITHSKTRENPWIVDLLIRLANPFLRGVLNEFYRKFSTGRPEVEQEFLSTKTNFNDYPLRNIQKTMENHHFQWVNPLFLWSFSIAMLNYQRVLLMTTVLRATSEVENDCGMLMFPDEKLTFSHENHRKPTGGRREVHPPILGVFQSFVPKRFQRVPTCRIDPRRSRLACFFRGLSDPTLAPSITASCTDSSPWSRSKTWDQSSNGNPKS